MEGVKEKERKWRGDNERERACEGIHKYDENKIGEGEREFGCNRLIYEKVDTIMTTGEEEGCGWIKRKE